MSEDKVDKSYGLDPADAEPPEPPSPPARPAPPESSKSPQPPAPSEPSEPSEPPEPPQPSAIKALDVCPNCGSPMGGADAVVCLRCGFDLKSLKVIKVKTGETVEPEPEPEPDEPDEPAAPLCEPGRADPGLPIAMAVGGLGLLALGYLFGAAGLVEAVEDETAGFFATLGGRLGGLIKMLVRTGALSLAGLGGLSVLAHMLNTRIGNVKLAAVRMLGIFAVIGLLTFFNAENQTLEGAVELVCLALAFMGLATVLFRLTVRDAATLMGLIAFAVIGLLLLSALVMWAAPQPG